MGADRSQWQFPKNVAGKVIGWRADGKGLENKDLNADDQTAAEVPFDPTGLSNTDATDVQEAIEDLDGAIAAFEFDAVADMVAAAGLEVGDHVRTLGYSAVGDGGGALYEIVASGTGTGGEYIDLTGITGQAHALFDPNEILIAPYLHHYATHNEALGAALADLITFSNPRRSLNLQGLTIELDDPIDVATATGRTDFISWHRIHNGSIRTSGAMSDTVVNETGSATAQSTTLTVGDTSSIVRGMHVDMAGVAAETYVVSVDNATEVTMSTQAFSTQGSVSVTLTKFPYVLDFSGFDNYSRLMLDHVEFNLESNASGILLASFGIANHIVECWFHSPKDRAITDFDNGAAGISITGNEFVSGEGATDPDDRSSIAITIQHNDPKIRNNRAAQFRHTLVCHGSSAVVVGNHFWQGSASDDDSRTALIVFTTGHLHHTVTGNYFDNGFIELSDQVFTQSGTKIGFITFVGNTFTLNWDGGAGFSWLVVAPYKSSCEIEGIIVDGNVFRAVTGLGGTAASRVDEVITNNGSIDRATFKDVFFRDNAFRNITQETMNPVMVRRTIAPASATDVWNFNSEGYVPFTGQMNAIISVGLASMTDGSSTEVFRAYNAFAGKDLGVITRMQVRFSAATAGEVTCTGTVNVPEAL